MLNNNSTNRRVMQGGFLCFLHKKIACIFRLFARLSMFRLSMPIRLRAYPLPNIRSYCSSQCFWLQFAGSSGSAGAVQIHHRTLGIGAVACAAGDSAAGNKAAVPDRRGSSSPARYRKRQWCPRSTGLFWCSSTTSTGVCEAASALESLA